MINDEFLVLNDSSPLQRYLRFIIQNSTLYFSVCSGEE